MVPRPKQVHCSTMFHRSKPLLKVDLRSHARNCIGLPFLLLAEVRQHRRLIPLAMAQLLLLADQPLLPAPWTGGDEATQMCCATMICHDAVICNDLQWSAMVCYCISERRTPWGTDLVWLTVYNCTWLQDFIRPAIVMFAALHALIIFSPTPIVSKIFSTCSQNLSLMNPQRPNLLHYLAKWCKMQEMTWRSIEAS